MSTPRILNRILTTSLTIITVVSIGLAWLITLLHAQNRYNQTTTQMMINFPIMAVEFRGNNLIPITQTQEDISAEQDPENLRIVASCDNQFSSLWLSDQAQSLGLNNICEQYQHFENNSAPFYLQLNSQSYIAHKLSIDVDEDIFHILVLKDATALQNELADFNQLILLRLLIVLSVAYCLLIATAFWGLQPLKQLKSELNLLFQGKEAALSNNYPVELKGITQSLNQLLTQAELRQVQYQNAMDDLAHSLKTRLAASKAIIDDNDLNQQQQNERILAQINDMDNLVKYQLKRAMLGKQGLIKQLTPAAPIIEQLADTLQKIYRHKQIKFSSNLDKNIAFPISQGDMMELCGNLMDNAFRLCISQVSISVFADSVNLTLLVEDDGMGVDQSLKQKIIQRGMRADTQSSGQGIGLAVCQELVNSYHGTLSINESKLGGAAFCINIPLNH